MATKSNTDIRYFEGKAYTTEKYLRLWRVIINKIESKFDVSVFGFDPGFWAKDNKSNATISIPLWFARRIIAQNTNGKKK